jgi:hypothetical protein
VAERQCRTALFPILQAAKVAGYVLCRGEQDFPQHGRRMAYPVSMVGRLVGGSERSPSKYRSRTRGICVLGSHVDVLHTGAEQMALEAHGKRCTPWQDQLMLATSCVHWAEKARVPRSVYR